MRVNNKKGDLKVLLNEDLLTYYWMGFLLADGHFAEKHIKITISSKDIEHLKKLKSFLSIENMQIEKKNNREYCSIKTMDANLVPLIKEKFNIVNKKTYIAPDLSFIKDDDLLLSLIVGFIDGDGCISKKGNGFSLAIHCHSAWVENLDIFCKIINPTSNAMIGDDGYARFSITNHFSLKKLKHFVIDNKLPVLNRKWDKIDFNYIPHKEAHDRNFKTFEKMFLKFQNLANEYEYYDEKFKKLIYEK